MQEDKSYCITRICTELERHAKNNRTHDLYDKVRYLAREFPPRMPIIKKENNKVITDMEDIAEV